MARHSPVAVDQTRIVRSQDPEAMMPLRTSVIALTQLPCPERVRVYCRVPMSHSFTVLSSDPDAMVQPSDKTITLLTMDEWPDNVAMQLPEEEVRLQILIVLSPEPETRRSPPREDNDQTMP